MLKRIAFIVTGAVTALTLAAAALTYFYPDLVGAIWRSSKQLRQGRVKSAGG